MERTVAAGRVEALRPRPSFWGQSGRIARRKPIGVVALGLVLLFIITALGAEVIAPYDPLEQFRGKVLLPPGREFLLGTDNFGRDLLSRIIWGSRISLVVSITVVLTGTAAGVLLGLITGYVEGRTDMVIQRIIDGWMAFPNIIFALAILVALGTGLVNVIIAISISQVPQAVRVVRGTVLSEKRNVYAEAAQSIGCGRVRIMFRHILPNVTAPIIILATLDFAEAILAEASLSFLGVGIPPPEPSWGTMLSGYHRRFMLAAPWMAIFPGIAISLAVLGWNLFGDALRDVWDPRLRGAR